jgi:CheY-like chemotaxis protein
MGPQSTLPRKVLIADGDSGAANLLIATLTRNNIEVLSKNSGTDALTELKNGGYDALIFDWKLPDLSGLQMLNRVRQEKGNQLLPVLVTSGLVKKADFRLLDDYALTRLATKPIDNNALLSILQGLHEERIWYAQNTKRLNELFAAISKGDAAGAEEFKTLLNSSPSTLALLLLGARVLREHGHLQLAEGMAKRALQIDPSCVMALNELGKIYTIVGQHSLAIETLKEALSLSPDNIERLCPLGESELKTNDLQGAREHFKRALDIDAANPKAEAGKIVVENIEEYFKTANPENTATTSFASLCNTIGISMVKTGRFDDGMKQYESAMQFAGSGMDAARVAYNLGLGFIRWKKPHDAHFWLKRSVELSGGTFAKAAELTQQVERHLDLTPQEAVTPEAAGIPAPAAPISIDEGLAAYNNESFLEDFVNAAPELAALKPGGSKDEEI